MLLAVAAEGVNKQLARVGFNEMRLAIVLGDGGCRPADDDPFPAPLKTCAMLVEIVALSRER